MIAECGNVQRIFVRSVGFGFGNGLRRADEFLYVVFVFVVPSSLFVAVLIAGCSRVRFLPRAARRLRRPSSWAISAGSGLRLRLLVFFVFVRLRRSRHRKRSPPETSSRHQILLGIDNAGGEAVASSSLIPRLRERSSSAPVNVSSSGLDVASPRRCVRLLTFRWPIRRLRSARQQATNWANCHANGEEHWPE